VTLQSFCIVRAAGYKGRYSKALPAPIYRNQLLLGTMSEGVARK
jgi:hypothetical protein